MQLFIIRPSENPQEGGQWLPNIFPTSEGMTVETAEGSIWVLNKILWPKDAIVGN